MTSFDPSSDELVSAYLDGEATEAERARIEADPELRSRVETFRLVSSAVATPPVMPDSAAREAAIAAALGASRTTKKVTSLAPVQERRGRFSGAKTSVLSAAAVILVLFLGAAIIGNLGGNDASDSAAVATDDASSDFDGGSDDAAEASTAANGLGAADSVTEDSEAMEDDEAMDDGDAMESDEAMEDEAPEDEAMEEPAVTEETADDDASASDESGAVVVPRTFTSLEELTAVFTAEAAQAGQELLLAPATRKRAEACQAEQDESNTNSLVFIAPAMLIDEQQVSVDVLVYRDDLIDTDQFIRVFDASNCEPIQ